jgi:CubicO group peptidase (beta-lactamase class C family)
MTTTLPRSRPEAEGVPSGAVAELIGRLDELRYPHAAMLLRHGRVIAETVWEPYELGRPHSLFSISKSFTSMAVGYAVEEGLLTIDDHVVDLLPDDLPAEVSPNLAAMRVRHLLTMTTGHDVEPMEWDRDPATFGWAESALAAPIAHEPGTHWLYNTPASYLLSAIVQRLTGQRLTDYLRPRLFDPLGFVDPVWEQSPQGIDAGGFGLSIRLEELAAFGQLLLQRGEWDGQQVVPASWIDEATTVQVQNTSENPDWASGYGYQFWRCRHGAYRGDGAFGQFVVVMPEQDAVFAMNSGLMDMQPVLDILWELLPAFDTSGTSASVPSSLGIAPLGGELRDEPVEYHYDGPFPVVRVEGPLVTLGGAPMEVRPDRWSAAWHGEHAAATSGGWVGDEYVAQLRLIETPFTYALHIGPTGHLRLRTDIGFEGSELFWEGDPIP